MLLPINLYDAGNSHAATGPLIRTSNVVFSRQTLKAIHVQGTCSLEVTCINRSLQTEKTKDI